MNSELINAEYKFYSRNDQPVMLENYNLAEDINKHLDTMTEREMLIYFNKCYANETIRKMLLKYEFNIYTPIKKTMTFDEFIYEARKNLIRYHKKIGGFEIDDVDWSLYRGKNRKYKLKDNEIIFENTVNERDIHNQDLLKYLLRLVNILDNIAINVRITNKCYKVERDKIYIIMIKCVLLIPEEINAKQQNDNNIQEESDDEQKVKVNIYTTETHYTSHELRALYTNSETELPDEKSSVILNESHINETDNNSSDITNSDDSDDKDNNSSEYSHDDDYDEEEISSDGETDSDN